MLGLDLFEDGAYTIFCTFLACLFVPIFILALLQLVNDFKELKSNSIKTYWLILTLFYIGAYVLVYPGFISYDDSFLPSTLFKSQILEWLSFTYSNFISIGYILTGGPGFSVGVALFYFLFLALKIFKIIDASLVSASKKHALGILFFLLALHPLNQGLLLSHSRDVLFSLILGHVGLIGLYDSTWKKYDLILIGILLVLLSDIRQEAVIYIVAIPVLFKFYKIIGTAHLLWSCKLRREVWPWNAVFV